MDVSHVRSIQLGMINLFSSLIEDPSGIPDLSWRIFKEASQPVSRSYVPHRPYNYSRGYCRQAPSV